MRKDNRTNNQLRPVKFTPNFTDYAEGSVLIEMGQTRVLCNASIEERVPAWLEGSGGGWLTAEYGLLPRSTHQRISRKRSNESSRSKEIERLIGRSLRTAIKFDKLGARTIIVDCDVIQADGGTRTASITGGYVAMALALQELINQGKVPPEVLRMSVAAISVGVVNDEHLLDMCYEEDSAADVDFNVVMTDSGGFIEVQGTAEGQPFAHDTLLSLLDLARHGIEQLLVAQAKVLGEKLV